MPAEPDAHSFRPSAQAPSGGAERKDCVATLARILWDWLRIGEDLRPADAILVLGSAYLRSAVWGARLFLEGWAPLLVISGGRGPLTRDWPKTEAETFADEAVRLGVPRGRMLLETRSTNTGENIRFTRALIEEGRCVDAERRVRAAGAEDASSAQGELRTAGDGMGVEGQRSGDPRGLHLSRWILVHAPYLERRARATFAHYWPGKEAVVTSHPMRFDDLIRDGAPAEGLVHRLVGEVHRMLEYPSRGWQAPDAIPERVLAAWRELIDLGYRRGLIA